MLDTLLIGTSGLLGYSQGLRVVGNNLANVNTPGFKKSQPEFSDLFDKGSNAAHANGRSGGGSRGVGLNTLGAQINFKSGIDQGTGNPLDVMIDGNGMFVIRRDDQLLYTRAGDFQFNAQDILVNTSGDHVQALDSSGKLADVQLGTLARNPPKATSTIKISGNLTSTVATPAIDATMTGLNIIDAAGASHTVNLIFKDEGGGNFKVTVNDVATGTAVGTGELKFNSGFLLPGFDVVTFAYSSATVPAFDVKLDFTSNVNSFPTPSSLSLVSQDGYLAGSMTEQGIGADGTLSIRYSNNQTAKGPRLALANFHALGDLVQVGGGAFSAAAQLPVQYGYAGVDAYGKLAPGHREGSNVDLAEEFSNLILMQRGYQASSHVISTANDMIQELFDMKGRR